MKKLLTLVGLSMAGVAMASPSIDPESVEYVQDQSRLVTVAYTLENEPAVVTFDVLTNGVSIGQANIRDYAGDVAKKVQPGARSFTWRPDLSWPGFKIRDNSVRIAVTAWATNAPPDYMVVDIDKTNGVAMTADARVRYYVSAEAVPGGVQDPVYRMTKVLMRKIPAANVRWRMGALGKEFGQDTDELAANEKPHMVTLTEDYYLGVFEVTRGQYRSGFYNGSPCSAPTIYDGDELDECPIHSMPCNVASSGTSVRGVTTYNWVEHGHTIGSAGCILWEFRNTSKVLFDLPTEAQWEFACRAGESAALYNGYGFTSEREWTNPHLQEIANANDQSGNKGRVSRVGKFKPNAFGLYDMLGNVQEYCLDHWQADLGTAEVTDPKGSTDASTASIVRRGGEGYNSVGWCRSAYRTTATKTTSAFWTGFRLWAPAVAP